MYQMRKTRIEVRADLFAPADIREAVKLLANDWRDNSLNIADGRKDKADVDSTNIDLAEFGIHTEILLANSVKETYHR